MKYNGIKVLTTKKLADMFGTDIMKIYSIYHRYKEKFIEGQDYFLLNRNEIVQWINQENTTKIKYASTLYLWTEQGSFKLAQHLTGLTAWQGYCNCIYYYFGFEEDFKQIFDELYNQLEQRGVGVEK